MRLSVCLAGILLCGAVVQAHADTEYLFSFAGQPVGGGQRFGYVLPVLASQVFTAYGAFDVENATAMTSDNTIAKVSFSMAGSFDVLDDHTNQLDFVIGNSPADQTADRELFLLKDGTYDLTYSDDLYGDPLGEISVKLETLDAPTPPSTPTSPTPEPSSVALLGSGLLAGAGLVGRRRSAGS